MGIPIDTGATAPAAERAQFNAVMQQICDQMNASLVAGYKVACDNYMGLQQHGPTNDPVPKPPHAWKALAKPYPTLEEMNWDARFNLPSMLVPTETKEPVAPQFVPPAAGGDPGHPDPSQAGTTIAVGPWLREEIHGSMRVQMFAAMPKDDMPEGFTMPFQWSGKSLTLIKRRGATPWGTSQWYEGA